MIVVKIEDRKSLEKLVDKDGNLEIDGTLEIKCDLIIKGHLKVKFSIKAGGDIIAGLYITAGGDIKTGLRIFAGILNWRKIEEQEKRISCKKLIKGEIAYGILVEGEVQK